MKALALFLLATLTLPDPAVTPGATRPVTLADLCPYASARAYRETMRPGTKARIAGRDHQDPRCCELDHLIPLELGGANDDKNLWLEPWKEAEIKDRLENRLHDLVCQGSVMLGEAQHAMASNWIIAYHRYGEPGG